MGKCIAVTMAINMKGGREGGRKLVQRFSFPSITSDTLESGIGELTEGERGTVGVGAGEREKK